MCTRGGCLVSSQLVGDFSHITAQRKKAKRVVLVWLVGTGDAHKTKTLMCYLRRKVQLVNTQRTGHAQRTTIAMSYYTNHGSRIGGSPLCVCLSEWCLLVRLSDRPRPRRELWLQSRVSDCGANQHSVLHSLCVVSLLQSLLQRRIA